MRDVETIERNLRAKQDAFFAGCEVAEPPLTMAMLAARSGIPVETLRSYRTTNARKPSIMGLAVFVRLVGALPEELVHLGSLLIEDSGCFVARTDPRAAAWLELGDRAGAFASKVCRYQASGGHIDHVEDADLRTDLIEIVSGGHGMLGGGQ